MTTCLHIPVLCFLCSGILKFLDVSVSASHILNQRIELGCLFESKLHTETNQWLKETGTNKLRARLLFQTTNTEHAGHHQESSPADEIITFIVKESSVDLLQFMNEDSDKLQCEISHYFTDNTQVLWPGIKTGGDSLDSWFICTIKHMSGKFSSTTFFRQLESDLKEAKQDPEDGPKGQSDTLLLSAVFLVYTRTPVLQTGLKKDILLDCGFSVDHPGDVNIQWRVDQQGGKQALIFTYRGSGKQVEHIKKGAEMRQDLIAQGNASLLLKEVSLENQGAYHCLISVSSLFGEQRIQVEIMESPTVTLNAVSLSLVEGEEQKLVCNIQHYYPLEAHVQWLRDSREERLLPEMVNNVLLSSHKQNSDGTFSVSSFFMLKASLRDDGVTYTCRVEHPSLKYSIRKSVTVEVTEHHSPWNTTILVMAIIILTAVLSYMLHLLHQAGRRNSIKRKPY